MTRSKMSFWSQSNPQNHYQCKSGSCNEKIQASYNDNANKIVKQATKEKSAIKNLNFLINLALVTIDTKPVPEEPQTFNEALDHPNKNSWKKWWEVICKEFSNINKQQVWHMTHESLMHPNHRCIKNKWAFKIKHNGVYWLCLVACGYSQVPGVDFFKNSFPVVNNITFCILLLMVLHFGYLASIVNVENTFLYRDPEEEIHMECPQSMLYKQKDDLIILHKCIYGLVQAVRQYYKKAIEILKNLDS